MGNRLLNFCRIKHMKYVVLAFLGVGALTLFLVICFYPDYFKNGKYIQAISFSVGSLIGRYFAKNRMICLAKMFPKSCGRRRCLFTRTCSLDLKMLLLNIDRSLPSIENIKMQTISFLEELKGNLESITECSYSYLFTGSCEERFGIPYTQRKGIPQVFESLCSDLDVMFCCEDYVASFTQHEDVQIKLPQIHGVGPLLGFAELMFHNPESGCDELLDSYRLLQSVKLALNDLKLMNIPGHDTCCLCLNRRLQAVQSRTSVKIAVKLNDMQNSFEGDITVCVRSPEWPPLSDWPNRSRCWPNDEDVQRIVSQGFHLVAKPLRHERLMLPTWRYSFSAAEVELSKLVPDTARKCFMALKVIFKDHLKPILPELSTYHIKTVFLNTLEKHPAEFWIEENIETCFHTLLIELHTVFDTVYCGHYWLRGLINLFEELETENRDRLKILADKVMEITNDPAPYIYDDGHYFSCTSCLCLKRSPQQHRSCTSRQCLLVTNSEIDGETQV